MKIQIDTVNKTLQIEEDVNLHDFIEQINGILPNGGWREYTLKVGVIEKFVNPITITPHTPINPYQPTGVPNTNPYDPIPNQIWYGTTTGDSGDFTNGIINYNINS